MVWELQSRQTWILAVCIGLPCCTWYSLVKKWMDFKRRLEDKIKCNERHNCVVTYNPGSDPVITGWPGSGEFNFKMVYDPILYFIDSATKSLDIALMSLTSDEIQSALCKAHKRGVVIRLLLDQSYSKEATRLVRNAGIDILYFSSPLESIISILHYKCAIRDYSDGKGFVLIGSMNWTRESFYDHFENLIFSTHSKLVQDHHRNFEESWKIVKNISSHVL